MNSKETDEAKGQRLLGHWVGKLVEVTERGEPPWCSHHH